MPGCSKEAILYQPNHYTSQYCIEKKEYNISSQSNHMPYTWYSTTFLVQHKIYAYLPSWYGLELHLYNSPAFNDKVLELLSAVQPLGRLVHNCTNFSIMGLKRMVEARLQSITGFHRRLSHLAISGRDPMISEEDEHWFRAQLDSLNIAVIIKLRVRKVL